MKMSMRTKRGVAGVVLFLIVALSTAGARTDRAIWFSTPSARAGEEEHDHDHEHEPARGPHGGRLLVQDDLAIEVTIFERGVSPQYRVYAYERGRPLDPGEIDLTIQLSGLGGRVEEFRFTEEKEYLVGDRVVEEPHSFDVTVVAVRDGRRNRWTYPSYEGRVELTPEAIESANLVIETAGPAMIQSTVIVYGRVVPNGDRLTHIVPRFPGIVKQVRKGLGDSVAAGEVLAIVESNESLQPYEVRSAMAGSVIQKDVTPGTFAREGEVIFTVADTSSVWIDFHVPPQDISHLRVGQRVTVGQDGGVAPVESAIRYVSPIRLEAAQTTLVRVEIDNTTGDWRPGSFVTGEIVVGEVTVPLAVRATALQTFRDWDVVFLNEGNLFEVRPLELGRRDADWVEVLGGLEVGQRYAARNTFILKADVGKSGAAHDH